MLSDRFYNTDSLFPVPKLKTALTGLDEKVCNNKYKVVIAVERLLSMDRIRSCIRTSKTLEMNFTMLNLLPKRLLYTTGQN